MRISDWSSDVCSSDLVALIEGIPAKINLIPFNPWPGSRYVCSDGDTIERFAQIVLKAGYASPVRTPRGRDILAACGQLKSESAKLTRREARSEEHTSELQSLMRISYAVFCLKKKKKKNLNE